MNDLGYILIPLIDGLLLRFVPGVDPGTLVAFWKQLMHGH